jgi:hypothetical protein
LPDIEITEEMQDEAYAALMASPTSTAAFLPKPTPMSELLPSAIVSRLEDSRSLVGTEKPQWDMVLHQLEANGGLEGMLVSDVNGLILCMDIRSRAEFSSKVCELMLKASLEPDTFTYDLLMLAHAELTQPLRVRELFQDLKKSKSQSLVTLFPHFFSFSIFWKGFPTDVPLRGHIANGIYLCSPIESLCLRSRCYFCGRSL